MDLTTWCLVVIYIGYWRFVDSLLWDVESTLKFDYKGVNIPMGPNGTRFELICLVGMDYEAQIDSRFIFMHKGILVITQGCIGVSEQGIWIGVID